MMRPELVEELRVLKEYNRFLNEEGMKRLIFLWGWKDREDKEARKNGM